MAFDFIEEGLEMYIINEYVEEIQHKKKVMNNEAFLNNLYDFYENLPKQLKSYFFEYIWINYSIDVSVNYVRRDLTGNIIYKRR